MTTPTLSLSHRASTLPPVVLTLDQDVPAATTFHLCSASFRLFFSCRLDGLTIYSPDREDLAAAWIAKRDGDAVARHGGKRSVAEIEVRQTLPAGSTLEVQLAPWGEIITNGGDTEWDLRVARIDEVEFEANPCRFTFHDLAPVATIYLGPAEAVGVQATRKFNGDLYVRAVDQNGITAPTQDLTASLPESLGGGVLDLANGAARVSVEEKMTGCLEVVTDSGWAARANPLPQLADGNRVFFGDIHWHTAFSTDGQRPLERALASSREELGLDFVGPADHALNEGDYGRSTVRDQAKLCEAAEEAGSFCTLPGFELSRRYGHCNIYMPSFAALADFADDFAAGFNEVLRSIPNRYATEELMALIGERPALVIPHHTNMGNEGSMVREDGRSYWTAYRWPSQPFPQHLRLIEINQQRGAFESEVPDPEWQPPFWHRRQGGLGGSAQTALARGHRIGFIGGTDNHHGWPTLEGDEGAVGGVTGVIARHHSRQAIFEALHARHCYATTGARVVAHATLNDHLIGSELQLDPNAKRKFCVQLRGTAPWSKVQLLSFGHVIHDFAMEGESCDFLGEWVDDRPERPVEDVYYYVRAKQADGHCVWLSPWWVDLED